MEIQIVIQDGKVTDATLKVTALAELTCLESTIETIKKWTAEKTIKTE